VFGGSPNSRTASKGRVNRPKKGGGADLVGDFVEVKSGNYNGESRGPNRAVPRPSVVEEGSFL